MRIVYNIYFTTCASQLEFDDGEELVLFVIPAVRGWD